MKGSIITDRAFLYILDILILLCYLTGMKSIYTVLFLLLFGCTSVPKSRNTPVAQPPPKGSSGSLGKNIDELDSVMNKSLSRIDKMLSDLGGK